VLQGAYLGGRLLHGEPGTGGKVATDDGRQVGLSREYGVRRGTAFQTEARQPPRNINHAVTATGPVPIDGHNSIADETDIVAPDIAVHQVVTHHSPAARREVVGPDNA
jgi:hypothetical protein